MELGLIHRDSRRFEEAATELAKATELTPGDSFAWDAMASALSKIGRSDDAIAASETECRISPGNNDFQYNLGVELAAAGRYGAAAEAFSRALTIDRSDFGSHNNLTPDMPGVGRLSDGSMFVSQTTPPAAGTRGV
jgi:Flp pilus assembly protein TadD